MSDQAAELRNLIQRKKSAETHASSSHTTRARVVAFVGGKGGVGTSNLAANLSVALAQLNLRVCLWEANSCRGQLDLLCGLNGYWNFGHVLTGAKSLGEVIQKGPNGINVVSAASGLLDLLQSPDRRLREMSSALDMLDQAYDFLVFDLGAGLPRSANPLIQIANDLFLVCTPEPTAITQAYSTLKAGMDVWPSHMELLVNRTVSEGHADEILRRFGQTTETFLRRSAPEGLTVAEDPAVPAAVVQRQPFVSANPNSAASRDIARIAKKMLAGTTPVASSSFFQRLTMTVKSPA